MKRLKFTLAILFVGFLSMNCAKVKNARDLDVLSKAIKGQWNINYKECCGRTSSITYGGKESIRFNVKKSIYTLYEGDSIVSTGKYTMETTEIGTMIKMENSFSAIVRIEDGNLLIDRSYMDLERKVYSK